MLNYLLILSADPCPSNMYPISISSSTEKQVGYLTLYTAAHSELLHNPSAVRGHVSESPILSYWTYMTFDNIWTSGTMNNH